MTLLETRVSTFIKDYIVPAELKYDEYASRNPWKTPPILEDLKQLAKSQGLWNMFMVGKGDGYAASNLEYCKLCEYIGYSHIAAEVFNCSAPDTGNMEVLEKFGSTWQKQAYLEPLLNGKIRSAYAMTEPDVSSSDATQIATEIIDYGPDSYRIRGRKWWITGAGDERCEFFLVFARHSRKIKLDGIPERLSQHSVIIVPAKTKGVQIVRPLHVFGYDDSPVGHCEIVFDDVVVPRKNIIASEGKGFFIAQSRLGPGRLHHCMRAIGMAERAMEILVKRTQTRSAFGKKLIDLGSNKQVIAWLRLEIDLARLAVQQAAKVIDNKGLKSATPFISQAKVIVPKTLLKVIDAAIQIHGAAGLSQDFPLSRMYASARTLRMADGVDEVHLDTIFKAEIKSQKLGFFEKSRL